MQMCCSNAIVAGLQVAQAIQYITRLGDVVDEKATEVAFDFPHIYCVRAPTRKGYYLQPCKAEAPSASCYVCNTAQLTVHIDTHAATLEFLVKKVLKGRLGFNQPSIVQGSNMLYEEGEDAEESLAENLPLMLDKCPGGGLADGSLITVEDFSQDLTVLVLLRHRDNASFAEDPDESVASDLFLLGGGSVSAPAAAAATTTAAPIAETSLPAGAVVDSSGAMVMDEDDLVFVSDTTATESGVSELPTSVVGKRSRSEEEEEEEDGQIDQSKKQRG